MEGRDPLGLGSLRAYGIGGAGADPRGLGGGGGSLGSALQIIKREKTPRSTCMGIFHQAFLCCVVAGNAIFLGLGAFQIFFHQQKFQFVKQSFHNHQT